MKIPSHYEPAFKRGFTLIEMIISVAIFSVVMVIVAAAYLNLINLDREARATDDVTNNLNFVVDSMGRAIRTGTTYDCNQSVTSPNNCALTPGSSLRFTDSSGNVDTYILTNARIGECVAYTGICTSSSVGFQYLTDPRLTISNLSFYVRGAVKNDQTQPQVIFSATGKIVIDATHAPVTFTIESSATQRTIDL